MASLFLAFFLVFPLSPLKSADPDPYQQVVNALFSNALSSDVAYENLRVLCETTEGRIAGSPAAAAAVEFTRQIMDHMELDSVYLQEMTMPDWKLGSASMAALIYLLDALDVLEDSE